MSVAAKKKPDVFELIKFRPYEDDAESFVASAWLRSYRQSAFGKVISKHIYFVNEKIIVNTLLDRAQTVIVTSKENPDQFQAFMNFKALPERNTIVLNYLYVKSLYRKMGYATHMIETLMGEKKPVLISTYDTKEFTRLRKQFGFTYNPYLVRGIM